MDDAGEVRVEQDGGVQVLTLSYPARRNVLSTAIRHQLRDRLGAAMAEASCRVVVLTGEGKHFCAGGDITSFEGITISKGRERMAMARAIVGHLVGGPKPVIAAVEGHAAGAGLSLAAASDIVVAARDAMFTSSFGMVGVAPDYGLMWSLPYRMGVGRAKSMILSARPLDAESAAAQGLVDHLAEPGQALQAAKALAQDICRTAPLAGAMVKQVLARSPTSMAELMAREADAQGVLFQSEDFEEGRQAFLEKRTPRFTGR